MCRPRRSSLDLHSPTSGKLRLTPLTKHHADNIPRLVKRAATIGRLFYHTAQCVLAQTNPMEPTKVSEEMRVLQLHHAHQVCGIVAHCRDRGVGSVAIRSLAVAGSVLTNPREQEEVLHILRHIHQDSGWHLGTVIDELKKTWGWVPDEDILQSQAPGPSQLGMVSAAPETRAPVATIGAMGSRLFDGASASGQASGFGGDGSSHVAAAPAPAQGSISKVNPLSFADFSLPNHPYQNWYEPPNRTSSYASQPFL